MASTTETDAAEPDDPPFVLDIDTHDRNMRPSAQPRSDGSWVVEDARIVLASPPSVRLVSNRTRREFQCTRGLSRRRSPFAADALRGGAFARGFACSCCVPANKRHSSLCCAGRQHPTIRLGGRYPRITHRLGGFHIAQVSANEMAPCNPTPPRPHVSSGLAVQGGAMHALRAIACPGL